LKEYRITEEEKPDSVQNKKVYRADQKCDACHVYGQSLLKCLRCPVAFHKACLGTSTDGPRGKWLCYFCKVMKFGVDYEDTVSSLPKEKRMISKLKESKGWREVGQTICEILASYACAFEF
jgi:hypothetical protein